MPSKDVTWLSLPAGDWATWVNAVVSFVALVAAIIAVKRSSAMLKVEQGRDSQPDERDAQERKAAERAEQADHVAAWIGFPEGLTVRNGSSLPIYDVEVRVLLQGEPVGETVRLPVLPPGEETPRIPTKHDSSPNASVQLGWDARREAVAEITFRDVGTRLWSRDGAGVLRAIGREVSGEAAPRV
jgi:hypothetical protein